MNQTDIPEDYDGLLKEYKQLKSELDVSRQELHDYKRQLKVAEALQSEYASEIEMLQSCQDKQIQDLKEKVAHLEESLNEARMTHSKRISIFEHDIFKKDEEIVTLQEKLKDVGNVQAASNPLDSSKLISEIEELKIENDQLHCDVFEVTDKMNILEKEKNSLEEMVLQSNEEINVLKQNLSMKREELEEHKELVQKLNDDILVLKSELESLKNKPLDQNTKGNSLFAEVNDRRVYLQETINKMKEDYMIMKQERAKHIKEISHLKKENITLCERWKNDIREIDSDRRTIISALQKKISTLEAIAKKNTETNNKTNGSNAQSEYDMFEELFDAKSKEIDDLHRQLMSKASTEVQLTYSLADVNRELRKWRAEALMARQQHEGASKVVEGMGQLDIASAEDEDCHSDGSWKRTLKGPKLPDKNTKLEEMERIRQVTSILKKRKDTLGYDELPNSYNIVHSPEENKENDNFENRNLQKSEKAVLDEGSGSKKVAFSENTVDTEGSNKISRRGKITVLPKPIYFGSSSSGTNSKEND